MAKSATLAIKIVSDAKGAAAGFAEAESKLDRFTSGLDKASVVAGGALVGIAAIGKAAFDAASDLQQSTGAIDSVFGDFAGDIEETAQRAAQAVGLSTSGYENLAAVLGAQLKGAGMSMQEVTGNTQDLITKGADLAATFGGSTSDAVGALSSALKGELDPIERYGISLKQSDVNARLAALGQDNLTGSALKTAQAQAIMGMITDQAGGALGAFGREADTAAGQTQRAQAEFDNAKASLGEALLPVVADGAQKLSELAGVFGTNKEGTQALVVVIGSLAAGVIAVRAAVATYQAGVAVATAVQWLWNTALTANPIGLIIVGVAALIGVVILLVTQWDKVKAVLAWVWDKLKAIINLGKGLGSSIGKLFGAGAPAGGGGGTPGAPPAAAMPMGAAPGAVRMAAGIGGGGVGRIGTPDTSAAAAVMTVNITVQGAVDPLSTGRQLVALLDEYARQTGRAVAVSVRS